jgi:hypothetical protein
MDARKPQPIDVKAEAREAARLIRQGLTQLGCCYQTRDGGLVEISFSNVYFLEDAYALVEVDTRRLPPRVTSPIARRATM